MSWKAIEKMVLEDPIWVLKYYMWSKGGCFVPPNTEGALKLCSIHGYYTSEEDCLKALRHFPAVNPKVSEGYTMEKVYKRVLI